MVSCRRKTHWKQAERLSRSAGPEDHLDTLAVASIGLVEGHLGAHSMLIAAGWMAGSSRQ